MARLTASAEETEKLEEKASRQEASGFNPEGGLGCCRLQTLDVRDVFLHVCFFYLFFAVRVDRARVTCFTCYGRMERAFWRN